jgi:hypothetical protein
MHSLLHMHGRLWRVRLWCLLVLGVHLLWGHLLLLWLRLLLLPIRCRGVHSPRSCPRILGLLDGVGWCDRVGGLLGLLLLRLLLLGGHLL